VTLREFSVYVPGRHLTFQGLVGEMDPIDEATGVTKRLRHLGFGDDRLVSCAGDDELLRDAIATFQQAQGLTVTGELDEVTKGALMKSHGV